MNPNNGHAPPFGRQKMKFLIVERWGKYILEMIGSNLLTDFYNYARQICYVIICHDSKCLLPNCFLSQNFWLKQRVLCYFTSMANNRHRTSLVGFWLINPPQLQLIMIFPTDISKCYITAILFFVSKMRNSKYSILTIHQKTYANGIVMSSLFLAF